MFAVKFFLFIVGEVCKIESKKNNKGKIGKAIFSCAYDINVEFYCIHFSTSKCS